MKKLARVSNVIASVPWAIEPRALDLIEAIVQRHLDGEAIPVVGQIVGPKNDFGKADLNDPGPGYDLTNGVATIPIQGPIVPKAGMMANVSALAWSSEKIASSVTHASSNADVRAMVLDINSPGGSVLGGFECADAIHAAAQVRPVVAQVNGVCASLAYLFASQANKIVATRGSQIGSIGVIARYYDDKAATHNAGLEEITVASSREKAMSGMTKEEITAKLRAEVDRYMGMFKAAVARGRSDMNLDKVATGEMWLADDALERGLVDHLGTLADTLESLKL